MFYFDPVVQRAIDEALKRIDGHENREDARQSAYEAIADEQPLSLDEAVACAVRAIERARNRIRYDSGRCVPFSDEYPAEDSGWAQGLPPAPIDRKLFVDTEKHHIPHTMYQNSIEASHERASARERGKIARARVAHN